MAKPYDLEARLVNFAADIALFCKTLASDFAGQYYGHQLLRSGGLRSMGLRGFLSLNKVQAQVSSTSSKSNVNMSDVG